MARTIVYTIDDNEQALKWLELSLSSLRKCLGDSVSVYVCTDSPRDFGHGSVCVDARPVIAKYRISDISRLRWYDKPVAPMQVFRLALPVVPELRQESQVVFVDADTEFRDPSWGDIFEEPCALVAGVRDGGQTNSFIERRHRDFVGSALIRDAVGKDVLTAIKNGRYANGGVLVMNLDALRKCWNYEEQLPKLIDLCVRAKLQYLDQDIINLFFAPDIIPSRYNSSPHLHTPGEPVWLEHYTGKEKWNRAYPPLPHQLSRNPEKMDVVYVVGTPSEHNDQELRWSLRSIAKYGRNIGRVIVTSPVARDWLSSSVIQVDSQDIPGCGYKHHNILKAIADTVDLLHLDGWFMVSSDDHFYVKEVDFANIVLKAQHWAIPSNMGSSNNVRTMMWKTSCMDTRNFLIKKGYPIVDFQMHRNSIWHGGLMREKKDLFDEAMKLRFCVEPHVMMQNLIVSKQPNVPVEYRKDCKLNAFFGIEKGCDCISIYDQIFLDDRFMAFMKQEFGEKCRYEI